MQLNCLSMRVPVLAELCDLGITVPERTIFLLF